MQPKFNTGEWCFSEFKLKQVTDTEEGRITGVTDGMLRHSGRDLSERCYPLELRIKRISDSVAYWSDRLHEIKINGINHPDLNRELIARWVEMCEVKDDDNKVKELMEALGDFCRNIINKCSSLRFEEIEGVKIFR